jgi:hypothetical protein
MTQLDELLIKTRRISRTWNLYSIFTIKRYQYWDKLLSYLFKYSTRCYYRRSPVNIEKFKNSSSSLKYFSDNFGRFSTSKVLIGKVTSAPEDVLITQHLFKIILETAKSPRACDLMTAEVLSKVLAYRNLKENERLWIPTPIPSQNSSSYEIQYVEYTVDTVFNLWHSHIAFGLLPVQHSAGLPILLFRGTDFSLLSESGRASILCDLDPDGPGRRLFYNSRYEIRRWLMQNHHLGKKTRVMGHSLGGVLATYTSIYEHAFLSNDPHLPSYAFNSPGVSEDLVEEWNDLSKKEKPSFMNLIARGDIVSKFGSLLENTYEMFTNKPLSPMIAHEQLIFSQPICYLVPIDQEKENHSKSRRYYSKIQKQSTSFAYCFGLKYLFPNPF